MFAEAIIGSVVGKVIDSLSSRFLNSTHCSEPPKLRIQLGEVKLPVNSEAEEDWLTLPLQLTQDGDKKLSLRKLSLEVAYEHDTEGLMTFGKSLLRVEPSYSAIEVECELEVGATRSIVAFAHWDSELLSNVRSSRGQLSIVIAGYEAKLKRQWIHRVLSFDKSGNSFHTRFVRQAAWSDTNGAWSWDAAQGGQSEN